MTEEPDQTRPLSLALGRMVMRRWRPIAITVLTVSVGIAAMIGLRQPAAPSSRFAVDDSAPAPQRRPEDPLRAELIRCRSLPANADDARCRAAWEINRRRFHGENRSGILPPLPPAPPPAGAAPADAAPAEER